jgi:acyl transferase domain-containing protein/NADPH:quinone reductase-like Zn-dependent oxidoreductase/acyl carrier protein
MGRYEDSFVGTPAGRDADGRREPIAIVGIGCRFPGGADSPAKFWRLLTDGVDAIVDIPPDRWNSDRFYHPDHAKPGKMYVRRGGFLRERVDHFDPRFFGIAPREAEHMDPQQRVLLEVGWEALEDAGLPAKSLAGSDTGVYIGGFTLDSLTLQFSPLNRESCNSHHIATAATMTMLSNRISYVFDFRGPSVSMDTACSSSLVALHYACQGIWNGECSLALSGGVNIMLVPEFPLCMSKGHFLAPDGHSKSFDERADGYARGEGCGIVVLKPLSAALRDGDDIYALIRGTGVNQDGRTDGITVPSADAQEALIRQVYSQAKVGLNQVRYVEAHGTGTPVGDPIEASVIGKTVGASRLAAGWSPCPIGSVKANIGHLEAAAGVAGVIKAALCLRHGQIPPLAGLKNQNPNIPFDHLGLRLPRRLESMPEGDGPGFVGVNSFGYGGTNAHALLEEAPPREAIPLRDLNETAERCFVLPISARGEDALKALARSYADLLSRPAPPPLDDVCYSAGARRGHLEHRLAVVGRTPAEILAQLQIYIDGEPSENLAAGKLGARADAKPVFVFSGMGPQWWAMGHELLRTEPVFREAAEACDEIFRKVAGWSILAAMTVPESESRMHETEIAQPANFVVQVALAQLLRSWGVEPAAVVGHSVGEVSAAYVSGALGLEDAVRVIYHRSRVQQTTSGMGRMLAVSLTPDEARELLRDRSEKICIAAVNTPTAVTLSGDPAPLEALAAELEQRGVFNTFLRVTVAYHSHQMEPLKDDLEASLANILPLNPALPIYSTVTGRRAESESWDGAYWYRNIRNPVLFSDAVDNMVADGHTIFLEIGPHPVLSASVGESLKRRSIEGHALNSLRRKEPEGLHLARTIARLYSAGYPVDWGRFNAAACRYTKLPAYPWQRERYWVESERNAYDRKGAIVHPLLGIVAWGAENVWECDLNFYRLSYLSDHIIDGIPLLPGAAYVEGGLAIQALSTQGGTAVIEDLRLLEALSLQNPNEVRLRWVYSEKTGDYRVYSRELADGSRWTLHASGHISAGAPLSKRLDPDAIMKRCADRIAGDELYPRMRAHGAHYAASFQSIREIWVGKREVLARLSLRPENSEDLSDSGYHLHPSLLDGSFQSLIACLLDAGETNAGRVYVPVRIKQVRYHAGRGAPAWSWGRLTRASDKSIEGNIVLCNEEGLVVAEVEGLRCAALQSGKADKVRQLQPWSYALDWEPAPPVTVAGDGSRWLVFTDETGIGDALTSELYLRGASEVIAVGPGTDHAVIEEAIIQADMENCRGVVYLRGLDISNDPADPVGTAGTVRALEVIQKLAALAGLVPARLYIVTRGAQQAQIEELVSGFAQAPLAGLARVVASEHSSLRCTLVDIDPAGGMAAGHYLAAELLGDSPEDEVALRGGARLVRRIVRASTGELEETAASSRLLSPSDGHPFTLEIGKPGSLDSLRFRAIERREPGPGEVEIAIQMASLNFKDVLKAMGVLPEETYEDTFFGLDIGMEAAGIVTRVGAGVTAYKEGDEVVASLRSSFSSHVCVPADSLMARHQSKNLSPAEWAACPVVFITAWYALKEIARLSRGEKVLIHAAAGGVGLAAIQVARWLGAEVFATAGSAEKRDYLRRMGVQHVFDSRGLSFADEILAETGGYGVDVVLNSIAGEALTKSVSLLAPFGRFVEIGKRDIVENNRLPMLPFNRNLSFTAFDLDRMMVERPALCQSMMDAVWERLAAGDFQALPVRIFGAGEIAEAFRFMAQSKQTGKVVVNMEDLAGVALQPRAETEKPVRADATYLITGAFGGIGLEVAKWAVAQGARHLVLAGRSGAASPLAKRTVEELGNKGVTVMAASCDVSKEPEVARLMADIAVKMPPLKGIFHAAAVLDDGFLADLNASRIEKVMDPKALGAWYLDRHTRSMALDWFVLFSSVSAWVGNPGQANYVAANAFLDALAQHRRAEGLPAVAVSWGAVGDVGMVAENPTAATTLARVGIRTLPIASVTGALASIIRWNAGNLCIADIDWAKWRQFQPGIKDRPRYTHLLAELETGGEGLDSRGILVALAALPPEKRLERLSAGIAAIVADSLHMTADKLDLHQPFNELGIDSLLGLELQSSMSVKLGIEVSLMELMKSRGISGLASDLLAKMKIDDPAETEPRDIARPAAQTPGFNAADIR